MIPESVLIGWRQDVAPWQSYAMVEQDLVLSRALVEIYNNPYLQKTLAFRGGTAIHKLFLNPQSRYSEDIDLVQISAEPIGEVLDQLRIALKFLGKPKFEMGDRMINMKFGFETEMPPVIKLKLKVEINCREHFTELGYINKDFEVNTEWFTGKCKIVTNKIEELLGTKLRALYQRRKGRDLFDLYKALQTTDIDVSALIQCYKRYMAFSVANPPSGTEFLLNMESKMKMHQFIDDTTAIIRPDIQYSPNEAYELVKERILQNL